VINMNQLQYIKEAAKQATEEKLTHLEHAEDHPLNAGSEGYQHVAKTLNGVHDALQGKKSSTSITTKYDGSPSTEGRSPVRTVLLIYGFI